MYVKNRLLAILGLLLIFFSAIPGETQEFEHNFPPHAIIIASYRGDDALLRDLLDAGVDMYVKDALGATALHLAMFQSNLVVVKMLLDQGFDPNIRDIKHGYTPLHNAVVANNPGAARLLVAYGASKYARDLNGHTPLDKARKDEKGAMVSLLSR